MQSVDMEENRSAENRLGSGSDESSPHGDNADIADIILFVGGLAKSCTDDELREPFLQFGDVVSARVQRSKSTSKPLGYGFVQMGSVEQAEKAKAAMNKALIGGHQVDINWAGRNRVLLVSNLAPSVPREEILELFARFGDIDREKSVEGECIGKLTTRCMTIHFTTRENAIRARNVLDRYSYKGNMMRVEWWRSVEEVVPKSSPQSSDSMSVSDASSLSPSDSSSYSLGAPMGEHGQIYRAQRRSRPATTSAYFRFESVSDETASEATFKSIFSAYGTVSEISMKTTFIDGETGRQRGYGFVHFTNDEAGRAAVLAASRELQRSERQGVLVSAEVSNTFRKQSGGGTQSYASCAFVGPATRYFYVHPQASSPVASAYPYPPQHAGYAYYPAAVLSPHLHAQSRGAIPSHDQQYWGPQSPYSRKNH